jgi:hypothetical protein
MLGEDIFRVGAGSINYFDDNERADFLNSRRKFVSQMALGLAAVPLLSLIYGITVGNNYKVIKQRIFFRIYQMPSMVLRLHKYRMYTAVV